MTEAGGHRPDNRERSPEYWDGHSRADKCPIVPPYRSTFNEFIDASDKGEEVLRRFLAGPRAIVRTFQQGEVIRAQDFNPDLVFKFNRESLIFGRENYYHRDDFWGVVVEAPRERLIMSYFMPGSSGTIHPYTTLPLEILPDAVMHHRRPVLENGADRLDRFRDIALYGHGDPIKSPTRRWFNLGRLVPRRVPGHS
jgi:hypothetical protein